MTISPAGRIRFLDFLAPRPGEPARDRRGLPNGTEAEPERSAAKRSTPRVGEAVAGARRPNGPPHLGANLDVSA